MLSIGHRFAQILEGEVCQRVGVDEFADLFQALIGGDQFIF